VRLLENEPLRNHETYRYRWVACCLKARRTNANIEPAHLVPFNLWYKMSQERGEYILRTTFGSFRGLVKRRYWCKLGDDGSSISFLLQMRAWTYGILSNRLKDYGLKKVLTHRAHHGVLNKIEDYVSRHDVRNINWRRAQNATSQWLISFLA
jgi:hypothetical protein